MILQITFGIVIFPFVIFFGYVTAQGLIFLVARKMSLPVLFWSIFFTFFYNFHITSIVTEYLIKFSNEMTNLKLHFDEHRDLSQLETIQRTLFWIPGKTSHTICIVLGVIISSWIRSYVQTLPKFVPTTRPKIAFLLGLLLHCLFLVGSTIWWYFFLPKFEKNAIINNKLDLLDGFLLGISHTLSFSVGNFIHCEHYRRMFHKKPEREVVKYYTFYATSLVFIPFFIQAICLHFDIGSIVYYLAFMLAFIPVYLYGSTPNNSSMHALWVAIIFIALALFVLPPRSLELLMFQRKMNEINVNVELPTNSESSRFEWIFLWGSLFGVLVIAFITHILKVRYNTPAPKLYTPETIPKIKSISRLSKEARLEKFPPPFPHGWYKFADSHEFEPGDARHISCLGREFVVFRSNDEEKKIYVMDAHCPHLGANLGVNSKVIGNCIECPFHHWQYRGEDGRCTHIPYSQTIPSNAKVHSYHVIEFAHMILVWFHTENQPPNFYPPPLPEMEDGSMYYGGTWEAEVEMHVQDFAENSADIAHFGILHSGVSFKWLQDFFYVSHQVVWKVGGGQGKYENDPSIDNNLNDKGDNTHLCSLCDVAHLHLFTGFPVGPDVTAIVTFVGPSLVYFRFYTSYGQILLLKNFLPLEGYCQKVTDVWYAQHSVPSILTKFVLREAHNAFIDDMIVWANKTYSHKALIIKADGPMAKVRRWFKQFHPASYKANIELEEVEEVATSTFAKSEKKAKNAKLCSASNSNLEW